MNQVCLECWERRLHHVRESCKHVSAVVRCSPHEGFRTRHPGLHSASQCAGYYEDGEFGIRIENLLIIQEAATPFQFGDQPYLSFERLTMCPLQRKMIDLDVRCCFSITNALVYLSLSVSA